MKPGVPRWSGRKLALVILGLWLAGTVLIFVQWHVLAAAQAEYLRWARGAGGAPRIPAQEWRIGGVLVPLAMIAAGLWLLRRHRRGRLRSAGTLGLAILIPSAFLVMLVAGARGPSALDRVTLPSGKQVVLAIEPIPTDAIYTLYRSAGRFDPWWRQIAMLDYSEDGRFTGGERLVLSPGGTWLAVARAGVWTDCFRMAREEPQACHLTVGPSWDTPDYERNMRARSAGIQRLTGMAPPR